MTKRTHAHEYGLVTASVIPLELGAAQVGHLVENTDTDADFSLSVFIRCWIARLIDLGFVSRQCGGRVAKDYASIARHSQCLLPRIVMTTSPMCHLSFGRGRSRQMQSVKWQPKRLTHIRTVSRLTITLRAANRSSTSTVLSASRWYADTAYEMSSRGERKAFRRGILVGMFI